MRITALTPTFHATTPTQNKQANPTKQQLNTPPIGKSNKKLYLKIGIGAAVALLGGLLFHSVRQANKVLKEMPKLYFGQENCIKPEIINSFENMDKKAKGLLNETMGTMKEVFNNLSEAIKTTGLIKTKSGSAVAYCHGNKITFFEKNHSGEMIRVTQKREDGSFSIQAIGEIINTPYAKDIQPIETYKIKNIIEIRTDNRIALMNKPNEHKNRFENFLVINNDNKIDCFLEDVVIGDDKKPKALKAIIYKDGQLDKYIKNKTHKTIAKETIEDCDKIYEIS